MNKQEVFDKVAPHLLKQNAQCQDDSGDCLYRNDKGQACAIGCLIPDAVYNKNMELENWDIYDLIQNNPKMEMLIGDCDVDFLYELQTLHDCLRPDEWREGLISIARKYGLNTKCIESEDVDIPTKSKKGIDNIDTNTKLCGQERE